MNVLRAHPKSRLVTKILVEKDSNVVLYATEITNALLSNSCHKDGAGNTRVEI